MEKKNSKRVQNQLTSSFGVGSSGRLVVSGLGLFEVLVSSVHIDVKVFYNVHVLGWLLVCWYHFSVESFYVIFVLNC